jgi:putative component of membrane protein insertase Oxa1/YidC/SpoIIIJ protein YidD
MLYVLNGLLSRIWRWCLLIPTCAYYRNETLADMSRAAWRLKQRKIAIQCAELALEGNIVSKILKVNPVCTCGL